MSDLDIHVTPLVEDCFYILLAIDKKLSEEEGCKAAKRTAGHTRKEYDDAIRTAKRMIANLEKYGIPCKEWSE